MVVNCDASAESRTSSDRCRNQHMLASMAVHFEGTPPNRVAGDTSVTTRDAQHQRILGGGLKIALRRCSVFDYDFDGLTRGDLFQAAPIGFLHGPQRWVGYQREQRKEQRHVSNSFHDFHLGSPYTLASPTRSMARKSQ